MRLRIEHRTHYEFSQPQRRLIQLLRVTPPSFDGQAVVDWHVEVDCDARLKRHRDGYGNEVTMLYVDGPIDRIALTVTGSPGVLAAAETHRDLITSETLATSYDLVASDDPDPVVRVTRQQ